MKRSQYCFIIIFMFTVNINPTSWAKEAPDTKEKQEIMLINFKNADDKTSWQIINDDVMGGISNSEIVFSDTGTAIFKGTVSLENNGGFASTLRTSGSYNLGNYTGLLLRIKGDGKNYQLRLRTDGRFDGVSYSYQFTTGPKSWMTIRVPFSDFVPVFRGRILRDVSAVTPAQIKQIGFLISDKQVGNFQLEIEWIKAYK